MPQQSSRLVRPSVLAAVLLAFAGAALAGWLLRPEASELDARLLSARVAELESENARLRRRLAARAGRASPPAAKRDEPTPVAEPAETRAAAEPAASASPRSAADWLARARALEAEGASEAETRQLQDDFASWLEEDPANLLALIAGLGEGEVPGDLLDLLPSFVQGNLDAQSALVEIFTSRALPEEARAQALEVYGRTLRRDALASGRFAERDREVVRDLAREGSGELRDAALLTLSRLVDDPASLDALAQAWNDPALGSAGMQYALRGLRHADSSVARPILLEALSGDYEAEVRWTAARGLAFLGPEEGGEEVFRTLASRLSQEQDWRVKGFSLVAMHKYDPDRTQRVVQDLGAREVDFWEQQKYAAVVDALGSKADWVSGLHSATRALERVRAEQAEQAGRPPPEPLFRRPGRSRRR